MRRLWIVGALALGGCGGGKEADSGAASGPDPMDFAVDEPGPYNVGFRAWEVSYEVLGASRTITVNAWYPTEATAGASVVYAGLAPDDQVFGDAELAEAIHPGGYPVHAHSHGHQGFGGTSADLMRFFASHGWVAVAPDHVGNLLSDDPGAEAPEFDAFRPMDVKAAVDALGDLPASDPLSKAVTDRYVLSGHSRGCTTTWSLLGTTYDPADTTDYCDGCDAAALGLFTDGSVVDSRVAAAIPMAGSYRSGTYTADGWAAVQVPVLAMSGTNDNPTGFAEDWTAITTPHYSWLELEGGCHQTFALGVCDTLDVPDGFWMIDTYAMAFARAHLLGDDGAQTAGLLDGSTTLDPRATLQVR